MSNPGSPKLAAKVKYSWIVGFAGIGYDTLPMLIHCRFDQVFACEWNPVAVAAFKASLKATAKKLGKTEVSINRSDVHDEDFANVVRGICHPVILDLLPSSRQGWDVALLALRPEGGLLHVHENASDAKIELSEAHCEKYSIEPSRTSQFLCIRRRPLRI